MVAAFSLRIMPLKPLSPLLASWSEWDDTATQTESQPLTMLIGTLCVDGNNIFQTS